MAHTVSLFYVGLMGLSMLIPVQKTALGGGGPGVPPVLSSPTATASGQTTADLGVSTTVTSGTMFWVVSTDSGTPSAAQIILGRDANSNPGAASGSGTVTVSPFTVSATGLTASTTYYASFVQVAAGGTSNVVVSASFTTSAVSFVPHYHFLMW